MKQLTQTQFEKGNTSYKNIASPETNLNDKQISFIKEVDGAFAYSLDDLTYKTLNLGNYYTSLEIDRKLTQYVMKTTIEEYYTKLEVDNKLNDYALKSVLASTTQNGLMSVEDKKKLNECFLITDTTPMSLTFKHQGYNNPTNIPTNIATFILENAKFGKYLRIKSDTNEIFDLPQTMYQELSNTIYIMYETNIPSIETHISATIKKNTSGEITGMIQAD